MEYCLGQTRQTLHDDLQDWHPWYAKAAFLSQVDHLFGEWYWYSFRFYPSSKKSWCQLPNANHHGRNGKRQWIISEGHPNDADHETPYQEQATGDWAAHEPRLKGRHEEELQCNERREAAISNIIANSNAAASNANLAVNAYINESNEYVATNACKVESNEYVATNAINVEPNSNLSAYGPETQWLQRNKTRTSFFLLELRIMRKSYQCYKRSYFSWSNFNKI